MLLSDYPYAGNKFWAEHSVIAAIFSSLLLVGVVFLAYETQERTAQDRLATSLSGAGLGGIVDVEVALALATAPSPPDAIEPDRWATCADGARPYVGCGAGRRFSARARTHDSSRQVIHAAGRGPRNLSTNQFGESSQECAIGRH